jgi:hypothetical protein
MTASVPILDPTDVEHVNSAVASWAATGEVVRGVNIARVVVQDDALADLAQTAAEMKRGGAICWSWIARRCFGPARILRHWRLTS